VLDADGGHAEDYARPCCVRGWVNCGDRDHPERGLAKISGQMAGTAPVQLCWRKTISLPASLPKGKRKGNAEKIGRTQGQLKLASRKSQRFVFSLSASSTRDQTRRNAPFLRRHHGLLAAAQTESSRTLLRHTCRRDLRPGMGKILIFTGPRRLLPSNLEG